MPLSDQAFTWISAACLILSIAFVAARILRTETTIRTSVYNTSRFRLFAARDKLVWLVADGRMNEDDDAWRKTYATVCYLLNKRKKRDLIRWIIENIVFAYKLSRDKRLLQECEGLAERLRSAAQESPEFADVLRQTDLALFEMLAERTNKILFKAVLHLLRWVGWMLSRIAAGIKAAQSFMDLTGGEGGGTTDGGAVNVLRYCGMMGNRA